MQGHAVELLKQIEGENDRTPASPWARLPCLPPWEKSNDIIIVAPSIRCRDVDSLLGCRHVLQYLLGWHERLCLDRGQTAEGPLNWRVQVGKLDMLWHLGLEVEQR